MLSRHAIPDQVNECHERLSKIPALASFALGGGTSLALRFAHRRSVDLDFFTLEEFCVETLVRELGVPEARIVNQAANSLALEISSVKVDFLRHHYELLEPVETRDGFRLLSVPDVAAMKLNAIVNRGSKKDFFDVVELLEHFEVGQLLDWFELKYPQSDRFIAIRSLSWFGDAESDPEPVSLRNLEWEDVKRRVTRAIAQV